MRDCGDVVRGSEERRRERRSEEHTSELQSLRHLVCRLLLEKKKTKSGRKVALMYFGTDKKIGLPACLSQNEPGEAENAAPEAAAKDARRHSAITHRLSATPP